MVQVCQSYNNRIIPKKHVLTIALTCFDPFIRHSCRIFSWLVDQPQKQKEEKKIMLCHSKATCYHGISLYAIVPSACCHGFLQSPETITSQPGLQRIHMTLSQSCILKGASEKYNTCTRSYSLCILC